MIELLGEAEVITFEDIASIELNFLSLLGINPMAKSSLASLYDVGRPLTLYFLFLFWLFIIEWGYK